MSGLGGRTKKVTTYGRKKTQIISIHSDISKPSPSSPLPSITANKVKRPILQSKLSEISNIPFTPIPTSKLKAKSKKIEETPEQSSPEIIFKARKVTRPGKKVIPKSPISSPSPAKRTSRSKVPEVVIPIRSTTRKVKPLGDLVRKFKEVTIEDEPTPSTIPSTNELISNKDKIEELLKSCSSTSISTFSSFLTEGELPKYGSIKKVGEASYSEVFGLTSKLDSAEEEIKYVLKVIPLLSSTADIIENKPMPDCSGVEDVMREIEVTKRMGQLPGGGFVEYIGSYVVEGEYPETMLKEWDLFKSTEGSASVRPSSLPSSQKYCLLLLSHAGKDLETFKFSQSQGWSQACSIFWQLVSSLSRAEKWTEFEHRDLHEGQILIHPYSPSEDTTKKLKDDEENYLDPSMSGLKATIIDFGLSRLSLPNQKESIWTELPQEVYEGKGSQWDLYRSMRDKIEEGQGKKGKKGWEEFNPITNVMWLHYLIRYIIPKLRTPQQPNRRSSKASMVYMKEEKAYNHVIQIEKVSGWSVDYENASRRRGLRGDIEVKLDNKLRSAGDVLDWGIKEGWVRV